MCSLLQLEKFRTEAEKLRKRVQVLEEEQQIEVQQAEAVQTGANVDFMSDKDEVPTKDKKVNLISIIFS